MKYHSSIVVKDGQAQYDCIVNVAPDQSIDISPFTYETPNTIALTGVILITDLPVRLFPVRKPDENLDAYTSRLIEIETRQTMLNDPIGGNPKAYHCNYIIRSLQ